MANRTCPKCGDSFTTAYGLSRHLARKRPCVARDRLNGKTPEEIRASNMCRFCGNSFSHRSNLYTHMKSCRVAHSDRGMLCLMEETVRRQEAQISELQRQFNRLAAREGTGVTVMGNVTINIHPFTDPSGALRIPYEYLHGMFVGPNAHPLLRQWFSAPPAVRYDASTAPPTIAAGFTRIMQKSHEDPEQRNVYLNPARQDQAMVWNGAAWQVLPLDEAIRKVFDTVADGLDRISHDEALLPAPPEAGFDHHLNLRDAVGALGLCYRGHEKECVERSRAAIAAHFANLRA